ncbi:MAG: cation:proton antiporter [Thermoplasmata archaeon]
MAASFFFEIGIIILLAFVGAYIAGRFRQSAIIGYIIVGVLIGPRIHISIAGLDYHGLIANQDFIRQISGLGLMFLLFFTGLGFSPSNLKNTWKPALVLSVSDVLMNIFTGFIIGALFGWPLHDTLFLAAIVAMSSVAVAAKSADEEKRLYKKEYNYLFGTMIVEDFISILLLTFASAFVLGDVLSPNQIAAMGAGVVIIYSFFFILALFIAPGVFHYFEKIQSNELFILFSLSVVFLSSAFADYLGIPPAIGAFLVGMAFAETSLRDKLATQMLSMKDAFVAIFFVSFGMLVEPGVFIRVAPMVALVVPVVVVNEVIVLGALAYLLGFTRRAAVSIGSGFLGRGEDAVLFASVGSGLQNPQTGQPVLSKAREISPFTGGFCFVMSALTPAMMRMSTRLSDDLARAVPSSLRTGGDLISRVLRGIVLAPGFSPNFEEKRCIALIGGYGASVCAALVTTGWQHWISSLSALALLLIVGTSLSGVLRPYTKSIELPEVIILPPNRERIHRFVTSTIALLLSLVLPPAALWGVSWMVVLLVDLGILLAIFTEMVRIHRSLPIRPPLDKEHILRHGIPEPIRGASPFSPKKVRIRATPPMRSPGHLKKRRAFSREAHGGSLGPRNPEPRGGRGV